MNEQTMNVNRGLAELKHLDSRIEKSINTINSSAIIEGSEEDSKKPISEFIKLNLAAKQSTEDLIKRRVEIKSAIVMSNATTEITICDKKMSVADAIERKNFIGAEKQFVQRLLTTFVNGKKQFEITQDKIKLRAEEVANRSIGGETKEDGSDALALYEQTYKMFMARNKINFASIVELTDIDSASEEIEKFEFEIDNALSESNIKTEITIFKKV